MKSLLKFFFLASLLYSYSSLAQSYFGSSAPTLQDKFPKRIGSLRFSATTLNLGRIGNNEVKKDTVRIYNTASRAITLSFNGKIPGHMQVNSSTTSLEAGGEAWIAIVYNGGLKNDFGFVLDRISISTNDSVQSVKFINITATIYEVFSVLSSEDSMLVQKARVPETAFNYGTIQNGEKRSHDFVVYNDGKRELKLHKAKSSCGCIQTVISKNAVAAGDSAYVRVMFDSFGKEGTDSRKISLYTNDPSQPEIKLEMNGLIIK